MRICILAVLTSFLFTAAFGQNQTFEIFGTISGKFQSKVYFFYDGNHRQKDSLFAEIKNGKFYFKTAASLPILARFHLGGNSLIEDVYIDSKMTFLTCSNAIKIWGKDNDTLNVFSITGVRGSKTENLKRSFEKWVTTLNTSTKSAEEKRQEYHDKLFDFVTKHQSNKVSPYLVSKASILRYSQVNSLNSLFDTTLQKTFEAKSVTRLLKTLDKTKNSAVGNSFLDVILKDTSGGKVSTKDLRGKYVLIEFWASWCKPCREMNPELKALYNRSKERNFEIIGVSFDGDHSKWRGAITKDGLTWIQVIDEKGFSGALGEHYDIHSIPQSILLDKEGKILAAGGLSAREVEAIIGKVL